MAKFFGLQPPRDQINELSSVYYKGQRAIIKTLLTIDVGNFHDYELIPKQKKIDAVIAKLNKFALYWSKKTMPSIYKNGYKASKSRLSSIGAKKDDGFNTETHQKTIDSFITSTVNDLIKANNSIKANVSLYIQLLKSASKSLMHIEEFDMRDEEFISGLLDDAIKKGKSRQAVKKLISDFYKSKLVEGNLININGRNYNLSKYAKMVARTRLRHIQSESVRNTCKQYNNDLVQISEHGTETEICEKYEGNIYSLSGDTPAYDKLEEEPPFHPNCMHSMSPTSEVAISLRG